MDYVKAVMQPAITEPGDYEENGLLMCGKCRTPKQTYVDMPDGKGGVVPRLCTITCQCKREALEIQRKEQQQEEFAQYLLQLRERDNVTDPAYLKMTLDMDDQKNPKLSAVCRRYIEQWDAMLEQNMGILFYGTVGTGKSFFACAIANELAKQMVPTVMTNFPRLLNLLQSSKDRQQLLDSLQSYKLLVIDDLGVERDSSYAAEQVYSVIDARAHAKLPLIVTTNLTMEDLKQPGTMQYSRIYDRVLEQCPITLRMTGESRRAGSAALRAEQARKLLL